MNVYSTKLAITGWAEEDRPREKMIATGSPSLTNAELIAILINSGSRTETAVGLSKRILDAVDNDLNRLAKLNLAGLQKFKGIGSAKAIAIVAALELGRRRQLVPIKDRPQIQSSKDAYNIMAPLLMDLPHEEFWILLLDRNNKVISKEKISTGGVAGTVVDAKLIFQPALEKLASSILLFHNHPSGNLTPSQADIQLTNKIKKAGLSLDVQVLDHLIISELGYYSMADEGVM